MWDEEIKPADEEQITEDVMWVEQLDAETQQWRKGGGISHALRAGYAETPSELTDSERTL